MGALAVIKRRSMDNYQEPPIRRDIRHSISRGLELALRLYVHK